MIWNNWPLLRLNMDTFYKHWSKWLMYRTWVWSEHRDIECTAIVFFPPHILLKLSYWESLSHSLSRSRSFSFLQYGKYLSSENILDLYVLWWHLLGTWKDCYKYSPNNIFINVFSLFSSLFWDYWESNPWYDVNSIWTT